MSIPTTTELAWAAGLFDGEGSAYIRGNEKIPRRGAMLTIEMTHEPTVLAVGQIFPIGSVSGPRLMRFGSKDLWRWRVHRLADVIAVGSALLPYLITKQEVMQRAITACLR